MKKITPVLAFLILLTPLVLSMPVYATQHGQSLAQFDGSTGTKGSDGSTGTKGSDGSTGTKGSDGSTGTDESLFPNPFKGGSNNLFDLVETIINEIILPLGGVLAVLAFIYAGFKYVLARGNQEKIKEAHRTLLYVAIGTAILLGAWVIQSVIKGTIDQFTF